MVSGRTLRGRGVWANGGDFVSRVSCNPEKYHRSGWNCDARAGRQQISAASCEGLRSSARSAESKLLASSRGSEQDPQNEGRVVDHGLRVPIEHFTAHRSGTRICETLAKRAQRGQSDDNVLRYSASTRRLQLRSKSNDFAIRRRAAPSSEAEAPDLGSSASPITSRPPPRSSVAGVPVSVRGPDQERN
jgi:hypothetical protein